VSWSLKGQLLRDVLVRPHVPVQHVDGSRRDLRLLPAGAAAAGGIRPGLTPRPMLLSRGSGSDDLMLRAIPAFIAGR
jgi:hypothetical protein